ncbi:MAG: DinB family protein [Planctomycetota bacterium]|jgi:uncharacterized damage-inducible protein DinB
MPETTLRSLFRHNDRARDELLEAAAPLGDEPLDRDFEIGPGPLRRTLHHLWRAERWWLARWRGEPVETDEPGAGGIAELGAAWRATAAERDAWLDEQGPAGEGRRIAFHGLGRDLEFPLGDMMMHVCNHGVHHRAQALNMLRRLGAATPMLDFLAPQVRGAAAAEVETHYDAETIAEYFRYGTWANERIADAAAGLDDAALDRPFDMGPGSLRRTLLHVHDGEAWWLDNWSGRAEPWSGTPETTGLEELRRRHAATQAGRQELLASLTDHDLQCLVTANPTPERSFEFRFGDTLLQVATHGTHHRAQAVNMLRRLGADPPGLDAIDWVDAGCP